MTTALVIGCGGTIGGAWTVAAVRARGTHVVVIRPDAADLAGLSSHFMRRSRRRSAFEASMRTAPNTVRRALAVSQEAR